MFKLLQKILIGFVMFLGIALVAIAIGIGAYLHFNYDGFIELITNKTQGEAADVIASIRTLLNNNRALVEGQIGLGLFAGGVSILGGIVVFGILGGIGQKKLNKA